MAASLLARGPLCRGECARAAPAEPQGGSQAEVLALGPAVAAGGRAGSPGGCAAFALVRQPLGRAGRTVGGDPGSRLAFFLWDPHRRLPLPRSQPHP